MKKIILLSLAGILISGAAMAEGKKDNECGKFFIQISNLTNTVCVLTSQNVDHGNLLTPPPTSIAPYDSKRFQMVQTAFGPGIKLSYQCGGKTITFTSKQNLCFWEAGDITGTVWQPVPPYLYATYTAEPGSYFWSRAGSISWKIVN